MVFNLNNDNNNLVNKKSNNKSPLPGNFSTIKEIEIDNKMNYLCLYGVEFENALFISVYLNNPKMGSFSLAFPIMEDIERVTLFSGKNQEQADVISQILSKKTSKLVYCTVNLENYKMELSMIKSLLDSFLEERNKNLKS